MNKCQNKTMRIINFKNFRKPSEPLFKKMKVLPLEINISLNSCLFVFDTLKGNTPHLLNSFSIKLVSKIITIPDSGSNHYPLNVLKSDITHHSNSVPSKCVKDWNEKMKTKINLNPPPKCSVFIRLIF